MSARLTREQLREWLDREPPRLPHNGVARPWRLWWFDADGQYLGERSARTGPDDVGASQPCRCEVCHAARRDPLGGDRPCSCDQCRNATARPLAGDMAHEREKLEP